MPLNWYKNLVNNIKSFKSEVGQLELNVIDERQKFKDIFERNVILEKEISERTDELNHANKSLLTLKHIWSTMNSSEPLSEVLSTVVNGLADGLNYLFCAIYQIYEENGEQFLKVRASNKNNFSEKIDEILGSNLYEIRIPLKNSANVISQSIENKEIKIVKNLKELFPGTVKEIEQEKLQSLGAVFGQKSVSILPITVQDKPFGALIVVANRNEILATEKNFLNLFVGQIELAVTIAGLFEKVREQAITDSLTGLYNRRYLDQCLISEAERASRLNQPFTVVMLDLDHLKVINDRWGHPAGDLAICHIGKVLKQNARSIDIPARFGGEEFTIILPGIDIEGGLIAAERIRSAIESEPVETIGKVTASVGVGTFLRHSENLDEFLELVDQALYRAKRNGRNQVQVALREEEANWQKLAMEAFIDVISKKRIPIPSNISSKLVKKLKTDVAQEPSLDELIAFVLNGISRPANDIYERNYTEKKVQIARSMAGELDFEKNEVDKLALAMMIYDLGNMLMPENILLKPGPLTDEEKKIVKNNPVIAAREILKPIKSASPIIAMMEHHHEHWDGSGDPGNLSGDDIPVGSRILSIINAYFALTSNRPYRKLLVHEEAVKILKKGANTEWDGKLVSMFINIIEKQKN
jgi:diguanylate cyclase (GGDEF)-like protein